MLLKFYDGALYSLSIVYRDISVYSVIVHMNRQYIMQMMKPVRLLVQIGSCLSLYGHNPQK